MSKAIQLTGGEAVKETVKFTMMFNKFFDCMNVSSLSLGKLKRDPFKSPYRTATDFRVKVIN